jgi:hypothetical protein
VRCNGELVGHVIADRYRHDLQQVGYLGDGRCSFDFPLPIHLSPLSDYVIELLRAPDGAPIPGSPVHLPAVSPSMPDAAWLSPIAERGDTGGYKAVRSR